MKNQDDDEITKFFELDLNTTIKQLFPKLEYFSGNPKTLTEFVESSDQYESVWPHINLAFLDFQRSFPRAIFVSGCIGCGSSFFNYSIFLYKVYLYTRLTEPAKYFSISENSERAFGIIGTALTKKLDVEALKNIMFNNYSKYFEEYKKDSQIENSNKIYVEFYPDSDIMIRFHYFTGKYQTLDVVQIKPGDPSIMLGKNLIYIMCTNMENILETVDEATLVDTLRRATSRVESRTYQEGFISGELYSKKPYDIELSELDNYFFRDFEKSEKHKIFNFGPRWSIFPQQYSGKEILEYAIDLNTETLVNLKDRDVSELPDIVYLKSSSELALAKEDLKSYIRDFIGMPTSYYLESTRQKLQKIIHELKNLNVTVELINGKLAFKVKDMNIVCNLDELYN